MISKNLSMDIGLWSIVIVVLLVGLFFAPNLASASHFEYSSISPNSGPPGTNIEFTNKLGGFLDIYFDGNFLFKIIDAPWTHTFTFPEEQAGTYDIKVKLDFLSCNLFGHRPDCTQYQTFTVTAPTISFITPAGASAGSTVSISGSGYASNSNIQIKFGQVLAGYVNSNSAGNINGQFQIPSQTPGVYSISTDWTGRPSTYFPPEFSFTIPQPYLQVPSSISYGDTLALSGADYAANSPITIIVNNVVKSTINADVKGSFSTIVQVNEPPGTYDIKVHDNSGNEITNNITILAPASMSVNLVASPASGNVPLDVSFTGTINNGVPPYTYEFNPGDGGSKQNAESTGILSFSHKYEKDGVFTASNVITDSLGNSELFSLSIRIFEVTVPTTPIPPTPIPDPTPIPPTPIPDPTPIPTTPIPDPDPTIIPLITSTFDMYPNLETFYVDRYNDAQVSFSGQIENYVRGTPVILKIVEPDGRTDERAALASKSGSYKIPITIRDNWQIGQYTIIGIFQDVEIGIVQFNVARVNTAESSVESQRELIPQTVRNVASWWSKNQVSDMEFANNVEFMIRNGMIQVPGFGDVEKGMTGVDKNIRIPDWIKNMITFWSKGEISDKEALNAIEFLVTNKMIDLKGEKRDEALGITPTTKTEIELIEDTLSNDGGLDGVDKSFIQIIKTFENNGVNVKSLLDNDTFLKKLLDKISSNQIVDKEGVTSLHPIIEDFVEDQVLSADEIEYLEGLVDFL